jgi:hypothetical protein
VDETQHGKKGMHCTSADQQEAVDDAHKERVPGGDSTTVKGLVRLHWADGPKQWQATMARALQLELPLATARACQWYSQYTFKPCESTWEVVRVLWGCHMLVHVATAGLPWPTLYAPHSGIHRYAIIGCSSLRQC